MKYELAFWSTLILSNLTEGWVSGLYLGIATFALVMTFVDKDRFNLTFKKDE